MSLESNGIHDDHSTKPIHSIDTYILRTVQILHAMLLHIMYVHAIRCRISVLGT